MCKSQAQGGQRCAAHTHIGVAATHYASVTTSLDDAQVASVFHRLRETHKDAPAPLAEEAIATLARLKRATELDSAIPEKSRTRLADRYDKAIAEIADGNIPDGPLWAAMQHTLVEAQVAEQNLDKSIRDAARAQRTSADRMAATFRKWRRDPDAYDDLESPNPDFRPNPADYPGDKRTQRALRKMGFENYLAQRLPCFVYGTLRRNQGNDRLMDGAIASRSEQAQVEGVAVYGAGWGFPYAMEAPDGIGATKGDLVFLSDDSDGDYARDRLDGLEGFNSDRFDDSHYRRVERTVTYRDPATGEDRQTQAWVYLAGEWSRERCTPSERIAHGDWVQGKRDHVSSGRGRNLWWDDIDDTPVDHGYGQYDDGPDGEYDDDYPGTVVDEEPAFTGAYVVKKSAVN